MSDAAETILADLSAIVGAEHVLAGDDLAGRGDLYTSTTSTQALCVVRPADTAQVSAVLAYCDRKGLKITPQGGRTGLAGGALTPAGDVALSLERLRTLEAVDPLGGTVAAGAGVIVQALQDAARQAGFIYPVDWGARGSATIGGAISTNAGGNAVFRYGMTRDQVLGLEAVLADGTVLSSMNRLVKNNAGYDLKQLFIGTEGTLGVVTGAVLRLRPDPGGKATAWLGLASFDDVLKLLQLANAQADGALTSFEVMWPSFLDTIIATGKHRSPLGEPAAFNVLLEIVSHHAEPLLETVIAQAWDAGLVADAAVAQNMAQGAAFWGIRDEIDGLFAALKPVLVYDVSLPQSAMADYVATVERTMATRFPQGRLVVFGHIADGNLHLCVNAGPEPDHHAVDEVVYEPLRPIRGSVSAEHGIGVEKRDWLSVSRTAEEIALMKRLKRALDPNGTLNPGKVI